MMIELPTENVQDYPRPPTLEQVDVTLKIVFAGAVLAETRAGWRVLETHHAPTYYLPPEDIDMAALTPVSRRSLCEWKGQASYFDIEARGQRAPQGAWRYRTPTARFAAIADHVAFYATVVDEAWVGGIRVTPQPGDFYGGWVTPNLTGRIKGAAGTLHW